MGYDPAYARVLKHHSSEDLAEVLILANPRRMKCSVSHFNPTPLDTKAELDRAMQRPGIQGGT